MTRALLKGMAHHGQGQTMHCSSVHLMMGRTSNIRRRFPPKLPQPVMTSFPIRKTPILRHNVDENDLFDDQSSFRCNFLKQFR